MSRVGQLLLKLTKEQEVRIELVNVVVVFVVVVFVVVVFTGYSATAARVSL